MRFDDMQVVADLGAAELAAALDDLCRVLVETVAAGGAIGFLDPVGAAAARAFWRDQVAVEVAAGRRHLFVARREGRIIGTVQLITAMPPNQLHRAEIAKMMVHPAARRQGVARALMGAALDCACAMGKRLLTLDTRTGDAAERLYAGMGFVAAGSIPDYALDPDGGQHHATTYMYRLC